MGRRFRPEAEALFAWLAHTFHDLPCVLAGHRNFRWLRPHEACLTDGLGYNPAHHLFDAAWEHLHGRLPRWAVSHGKVGGFVWVGSKNRGDFKRSSARTLRRRDRALANAVRRAPWTGDDDRDWGRKHLAGDARDLY